jgi:hypothetical protein
MKVSDLGASIHDAFIFLDKFSADVSKVVTMVEEKLSNKGLIALGDAATFWDHSRAYYAPGQWFPKYIIRHYTEDLDPETKRQWNAPWLLFFVVYLYPAQFGQPVAAWGRISQMETKNMWYLLKSAEVYRKDPPFLTKVPAREWTDVEGLPDSLESFKYQSVWLTDLKDATTVYTLVIEPLLMEGTALRESRKGGRER